MPPKGKFAGTSGKGRKKGSGGFTPQQKQLINHYFSPDVNFVKRTACRLAGYAPSVYMHNPNAIFNLPHVKAEIERRVEDMNQRFAVDRDWVNRKMVLLAEAAPAAIMAKLAENGNDLSKLTPEELYQLGEVKRKDGLEGSGRGATPYTEMTVKSESRLVALQSLAKLHDLNKEKAAASSVSVVAILQAGRNRTGK